MSCHKTVGKANTFHTMTTTILLLLLITMILYNIVIRNTTYNNYSFFLQPVGAFINGHQCEGQILMPLNLSPLIH